MNPNASLPTLLFPAHSPCVLAPHSPFGSNLAYAYGYFVVLFAIIALQSELSAQWNPNPDAGGTFVEGTTDSSSSIGAYATVADGRGGVFVLFQKTRAGLKSKVYVQWVDSTGASRWGPYGFLISDTTHSAGLPNAVSDGTGGFIAAWAHQAWPPVPEPDSSYTAQVVRVNRYRTIQWDKRLWPGHLYVGGNLSSIPVASDAAGGAYVMGFYGTFRTPNSAYVQRVRANGVIAWQGNGARVRYGNGPIGKETMIEDGNGGVFLAWWDGRYVRTGEKDLFAQRVDSIGNVRWRNGQMDAVHVTGISVPAANHPSLSPDGSDGLFIAYNHNYFPSPLEVAHLWSGGHLDWLTTVVHDTNTIAENLLSSPLERGECIVANTHSVRKIDTSANLSWNNGGPVFAHPDSLYIAAIIPDGMGGLFTIFQDSRYWPTERVTTPTIIRAQKLSATGSFLWHSEGKPVCTKPGIKPVLDAKSGRRNTTGALPDGKGGFIIVWKEEKYSGLYATRLTPDGDIYPVELESFTALLEGNIVRLGWRTSSETNNYGFHIERCSDRTNWTEIAFVPGRGSAHAPWEYEYSDLLSLQLLEHNELQYRLRQEDFDGATSYSQVRIVDLGGAAGGFVLAAPYPNPAAGTVTARFSLPEHGRVHVRVIDPLGQTVYEFSGEYPSGWNTINIPGSTFSSGMYAIQALSAKGIKTVMLIRR